jgi:hypothetical protein
MKALIQILALLGLLSGAVAYGEAPPTFVVKSVRGYVQALYPWSVGWVPVVSGKDLPYGTLLQIFDGGRISLQVESGQLRSGKAREIVDVLLANRGMIRLTEAMLRKSDVQRLYFDSMKAAGAVDDAPAVDVSLSDAWSKIAAFIPGYRPSPSAVDSTDGMPITNKRIMKIKLLRPTVTHDVTPWTLPVDFRVVWKDVPEANPSYDVTVWRTGEVTPEPNGRTRLSSYTVRLSDYGSYFVRVATADGRYESAPHRLVIVPPASASAARKLRQRFVYPSGEPRITVLSPPPLFEVDGAAAGGEDKARVDFNWRLSEPVVEGVMFRLELTRAGRVVRSLRTVDSFRSVRLPPGDYSWQLSATGLGDAGGRKRPKLEPGSASGRLKIVGRPLGDRKARIAELRRILRRGGVNRVVYLGDGL